MESDKDRAGWRPTDGTGTLWPDREKRTERSPTMTGLATIRGELLEIAAWERTNPKGQRFFGLSFRAKRPRPEEGRR